MPKSGPEKQRFGRNTKDLMHHHSEFNTQKYLGFSELKTTLFHYSNYITSADLELNGTRNGKFDFLEVKNDHFGPKLKKCHFWVKKGDFWTKNALSGSFFAAVHRGYGCILSYSHFLVQNCIFGSENDIF